MNFENIELKRKDQVALVTIQRPSRLNALSVEVFRELKTLLRSLAASGGEGLRGLLLTGAGDKAFVAGADIRQMSQMSPADGEAFGALAHEVTILLEQLPIPVIACVNGYALGGGCELALACDFIYATETAVFGQPEVNLGLIPGFGGCVRLQRVVGPGRAKEMIYTGRTVSAAEAFQLGLVNRVFKSRDEMLASAEATLRLISEKSPHAVGICKQIINAQFGQNTEAGLEIERKGFREAFEHPEKQEGVAAFLEKRTARFSGS